MQLFQDLSVHRPESKAVYAHLLLRFDAIMHTSLKLDINSGEKINQVSESYYEGADRSSYSGAKDSFFGGSVQQE